VRRPQAFDLKSRQFSLLGLVLHTAEIGVFEAQWRERTEGDAAMFEHDPVLIDLSQLDRTAPPAPEPIDGQAPLALDAPPEVDLAAIVALLRASRLQPVAVTGALPGELAQAQALGLADAADAPSAAAPREVVKEVVREVIKEVIVERPAASPAVASGPAPTLVIDKPLRSGQQVYAKGGDLVVLALVNHGAEVIADGSIHVYAPLRGKAIAGARGNTAARIFAHSMEAELVAIAGVYRTTENPLAADVLGKPAQVRLDEGDKLVIQPLTL
jgi:septum site-determining protein MinC